MKTTWDPDDLQLGPALFGDWKLPPHSTKVNRLTEPLSTGAIYEGLLGICVLNGLDSCFYRVLEDNKNLLDRVGCRTRLLCVSLIVHHITLAQYFLQKLHVDPNSSIPDLYFKLKSSEYTIWNPSIWMLYLLTPHFLPSRWDMDSPKQVHELLRLLLASSADPNVRIPLRVKRTVFMQPVPLRDLIKDHIAALSPEQKASLSEFLSGKDLDGLQANQKEGWKRRIQRMRSRISRRSRNGDVGSL